MDTLGKHANTLLDKGTQLLNDHMDEIGSAANQFIDQQADKYTKKASNKMDSYGRKKGSGGISTTMLQGALQQAKRQKRQRVQSQMRTLGNSDQIAQMVAAARRSAATRNAQYK